MKKRRFLATAAALAVGMVLLWTPAAVSATELGDDYEDTTDDGQEAGEQMTIPAPGKDDGSGSDPGSTGSSGGSSGGGNTGSTGGSAGGTSSQGPDSSTGTAKSSDSSLASLGISPGSLSPAFSPNTYEYTATVDANVTQVSIPARPNNSKAVIASVSGAKSIRPGTNTVKVVVEAESGKTSTYTITVYCGQGAQNNTPAGEPADTSEPTSVEGQISDTQPEDVTPFPEADDGQKEKEADDEVSFDSNGYLIYRGEAYIPSELMPEGEYVSLEKYNSLYEQAKADKTTSNRMMIIFVVAVVLLLIIIVNLVFKLRDVRQDAQLGIGGSDDDEGDGLFPRERRVTKASRMREKAQAADTAMIPDVKMPDQMRRSSPKMTERPKPAAGTKPGARATERSAAPAKTPTRTPAGTPDRKHTRSGQGDRDLEILDLNDL